MKTKCSKCGCTSTIMSLGNGCHNDNCGGIMQIVTEKKGEK